MGADVEPDKAFQSTHRPLASWFGVPRHQQTFHVLVQQIEPALSKTDEAIRKAAHALPAVFCESQTALTKLHQEKHDVQIELSDTMAFLTKAREKSAAALAGMNRVKQIKVKHISSQELDDLFRKHDSDNSGDIDPEEMKAFVEDLCGIMERQMEKDREECEEAKALALSFEQQSKDVTVIQNDLVAEGNRLKHRIQALELELEETRNNLDIAERACREFPPRGDGAARP